MKKQLLRERFQQLAGIKPLYELNMGQRAMGFIDRLKPLLKNLSPSTDGKELAQFLKDNGIPTTGVTMYDLVSNNYKGKEGNGYIFNTANIQDPKKTVKVNQFQIDNASLDSIFRASQTNINLSDNVPKAETKIYLLNLETGKYEFIGKEENIIKTGDIDDMGSDKAEFLATMKGPISISLEDLRTRIGGK